MSLITPESGFGSMHIESDGKASALFVDNTPVIYFDGNTITEMYLPDVKELEYDWISFEVVKDLKILELPNLRKIGDEVHLGGARKISVPNLKQVGDWCLGTGNLQKFDAPSLEIVGHGFLKNAHELKSLNLPSLKKAGEDFLMSAQNLETLIVPELVVVGPYLLANNIKLSKLHAPKLSGELDDCFMWNEELEVLDLPNVTCLKGEGFYGNKKLREVHLPKLIKMDEDGFPPIIVKAYRENIAAKEKAEKMQRFKQSVGVFQSADDANKKTSNFIKPGDWNR